MSTDDYTAQVITWPAERLVGNENTVIPCGSCRSGSLLSSPQAPRLGYAMRPVHLESCLAAAELMPQAIQ